MSNNKKVKIGKISLFRRISAYFVDVFIVGILAVALSSTININGDYTKYNDIQKEYYNKVESYRNYILKIEEYSKDEFTEEEYNKLNEEYPDYKDIIDKYYDNGLTKENNTKIEEEISKKYQDLLEENSYKLEYYTKYNSLFNIIFQLLYFIIFVYYVDGISLGKKILKMQVVSNDGSKATILQHFIRTIILTGTIFSLIQLISIFYASQNNYLKISYYTSLGYSLIEVIIILMASYRKDNRGLHDLIAGTKVIDTRGKKND